LTVSKHETVLRRMTLPDLTVEGVFDAAVCTFHTDAMMEFTIANAVVARAPRDRGLASTVPWWQQRRHAWQHAGSDFRHGSPGSKPHDRGA
jgi:hypothetical protein